MARNPSLKRKTSNQFEVENKAEIVLFTDESERRSVPRATHRKSCETAQLASGTTNNLLDGDYFLSTTPGEAQQFIDNCVLPFEAAQKDRSSIPTPIGFNPFGPADQRSKEEKEILLVDDQA